MNSVKEIDIKKSCVLLSRWHDQYKNLDLNEVKTDEKLYKNILVYNIGYVTAKDLSHATPNSVKPLYLIINKINWNIEEINGNKYSTSAPTYESKDALKKYEELWKKIKDLIRSKSSHWRCSVKKDVLRNFTNTCPRDSFLIKLQV